MTDDELRKLKRADLLELLLAQVKENEELRRQLEEARARERDRTIALSEAGSIAEASLKLSGIFEAAQAAASQYLENVERLSGETEARCRQMETESREEADRTLREAAERRAALEAETAQSCEAMRHQAEQESQSYWSEVSRRLEEFYNAHAGLRELLAAGEKKYAGE